MTRHSLFLALMLAGTATCAHAADPLRAPSAAAAAVTVEEVGDADSFGRGVNFIGLMSMNVQLAADCTPPAGEPANPNCFTLAPTPASTPFTLTDLASITLPARSSQSLLCHWQTPIVQYSASNATASPQSFSLRLTPTYRIQSEVLDEAGLVNPTTGLPYGGEFSVSLTAVNQSNTISPGDLRFETITGTRVCIGALVSKANLMSQWGLSEQQAKRFFRRPITITMGLTGRAQMVEFANINFGTRFVGD